MSPTFKRSIPILRMFDVAKAREFYVDYLGFTVDSEHRFHESAPLFMAISRDGMQLFLSEHHGDGSPGAHIYIEMSGLETFHRELAAKRYRYANPGIETKEWGTREVCVADPSGNKLIFSERISGNA